MLCHWFHPSFLILNSFFSTKTEYQVFNEIQISMEFKPVDQWLWNSEAMNTDYKNKKKNNIKTKRIVTLATCTDLYLHSYTVPLLPFSFQCVYFIHCMYFCQCLNTILCAFAIVLPKFPSGSNKVYIYLSEWAFALLLVGWRLLGRFNFVRDLSICRSGV